MEKPCEHCGSTFETGNVYWKMYCSTECRKTAKKAEYAARKKEWYEKNKVRVIEHVMAYRNANKEKVQHWNLKYLYRTVYEGMRTSLLEKYGNVCSKCGTVEEIRSRIHVHHVDFDRNNNSEDNLVLMCTHCHRGLHMKKKMHIYWAKKKENTASTG